MRRYYGLAFGVAVAAAVAAFVRRDGGEPIAAQLSSPGLQSAAAATADTPPAPLVGDAALAGQIDVSRIVRVDDHFEAPLPDGRIARLTLDPKYQDAAAAIARETRAPRAAIVVLAADGRVLALAGRRAALPTGSIDGTPDHRLALDVWAPAASIFKLVTAAALVDAGVGPDARVCFHGGVRSVMESNLTDNRRLDRRCESLTYGVAHSQNAIIAKLVHAHLEPPDLARAAVALGFHGDTPAWALGGRAGAVEMPDAKGVPFGKTAAGFTGSELSPLGGALVASTIANHGVAVTPRIVAEIVDGERRTPVEAGKSRQAITARVADHVADMMRSTCVAGSAAKAFRRWGGKRVGGKTGTLAVDKPVYEEFSWFVGFVDDDSGGAIAIAVLLGNAEDWWMKAHTAARRTLDRAAR